MPALRYSDGASSSRTGNRARSASNPTLNPIPTPSSTSAPAPRRKATPSLSWSSFTTHTSSNSAYTTGTSSRDRLPGTCPRSPSPRVTSRRTPTAAATNPSRSLTSRSKSTRHSIIDPAFVLTPLAPPPSPVTPRSPDRVPLTEAMSSSFGVAGSNGGRDGSGSGGLSNERPRRAVSSPQLVRPPSRARSDSASSSDALTATEENYARFRRGSTNAPRSGYAHAYPHGHGYGYHSQARIPPSASASRFPNTYPPLWTFAAQPISPTSPDSSEAATSPSDEASFDEDENSDEILGGDEEEELIFVASRASSSTSLSSHNHIRNRRGRKKENERDGPGLGQGSGQGQGQAQMQRVVTTARGQPCAGETETELDEFSIRLPTSRNVDSRPVVPLLIDILVPFLFQVTRFLSIVPATVGIMYNVYLVFNPPKVSMTGGAKISSIDYVVCALWATLTGFQCLFLTTGLLSRWKAYYATLSTLVRLVALQCICWPATHFTLMFFDHTRRPVACWALIGTTTCISRSVQLWVTSNLYMPINSSNGLSIRGEGGRRDLSISSGSKVLRSEGRLGPRRWDWAEVLVKCVLPAGILYFVTAWAMLLKQELEVR